MNILELENVDAGYGSLQVLRDITFGVPQREVVALIGPNGAGKTTVMRSIAGVVRTTAGTIRYMGEDVTARRYHERVNGGVGWVPEGRHIFTDMTVDDNLYVSAATAGQRKRFPELRKRVSEMFPMLADRGKDRAGSLSGGQQQMLAIARALVRDPDLVILDEPSMGLAPSIVLGLGTTIRHMLDLGVAVLVADQSVSWLEGLAGSAVFIQGGQIVLTGDLDLIRDRDLVSRIYLGETVRATDGGQANAHARRRP